MLDGGFQHRRNQLDLAGFGFSAKGIQLLDAGINRLVNNAGEQVGWRYSQLVAQRDKEPVPCVTLERKSKQRLDE